MTHAHSTAPLRRRRLTIIGLLVGGFALVAVGAVWAIVNATTRSPLGDITWPTTGSAALSIDEAADGSPDSDDPRPMASITKLITALVTTDAAPLTAGDPGPTFPMTEADAGFAQLEVARDGASIPVTPGQFLTERQLLEYVLVASSNNHATSFVTKVFGSEPEYLAAARRWLDDHGLHDVQVADASGMSPGNRASARDLLTIGRLAAASPVIAEITALPATVSPAGELLPNTNDLLGTLGIRGLKTGHTAEAGFSALFVTDVGDHQVIGVTLGAPSATQRTTDVTRLVAQVRSQLSH